MEGDIPDIDIITREEKSFEIAAVTPQSRIEMIRAQSHGLPGAACRLQSSHHPAYRSGVFERRQHVGKAKTPVFSETIA
jgi:hypothetical protein